MLGAITGDIVGSRFEFRNIKFKKFDLFSERCFFTDDTVLTLAIAKAFLECDENFGNLTELAEKHLRKYGKAYKKGYGYMFREWLDEENPKPYNSFGNGAAMRVSACGFAAKSLDEAKALSEAVTKTTHDHPEGLKGAEATAVAIYLAKTGSSKRKIRNYINKHYYKLDFKLDEIRDTYQIDISCQGSVPQAIEAFLESKSFEDAIRNAISIGGDSDTIAAIAGSIAEAYYGIPEKIAEKAKSYLDEPLLEVLTEFQNTFQTQKRKWRFLW